MDRKDFLEQIHDETPTIIKKLNDQNEMILMSMHNLNSFCIKYDQLRHVWDYDTVPEIAQEVVNTRSEIESCLQNLQSIDVPEKVLTRNEKCHQLKEENANLLETLNRMYSIMMKLDMKDFVDEIGIGIMAEIQELASTTVEHALSQRQQAKQQTTNVINSDGFDRDGDSGNRNKPKTTNQSKDLNLDIKSIFSSWRIRG